MRSAVMGIGLAVVLLMSPAFCGEKPPAKKLTIDEAVKLLQDSDAMYKSAEKRKSVVDAFAGLAEEQKKDALAKLLPLVGKVTGRGLQAHRESFLKIGEMAIVHLLETLSDDARWQTTLQILPYFREKALDPTLKLLDDKDAQLRLRAAKVLEKMAGWPIWLGRGNRMEGAVPKLAERLADESSEVVATVARVLGLMGARAKPAVPALVQALAAPDAKVRTAVAHTLGVIGGPAAAALEPLGTMLSSPDLGPADFAKVAEALMKVAAGGPPYAASLLIRAFDNQSDVLSLRAARSAAGIGEPAVPPLVAALKGRSSRARRFAACALAVMGEDAKRAVPDLIRVLRDGDPRVRRNAAEALGRIGDPAAAKALLPLLKDKALSVTLCAAEALTALAGEEEEVKKALDDLTKRLAAANKSQPDPSPGTEGKPEDYLIGGPLAGIPLPAFPTQHGEPPGHPGCIKALAEQAVKERAEAVEKGEAKDQYGPLDTPFTTVGQYPEVEVYPGASEHWRAYWMKYCPVRSHFDRQSQVQNWVAPDIPGATKAQVEQYAEPISWTPRWGFQQPTGYKMKPVTVVRFDKGSAPFTLESRLPHGVYGVRIIAAVESERIQWFRKPLLVRMTVNDGLKGEVSEYVQRVNYVDEFYSMCEMFFNTPATRVYRISLAVHPDSEVDLLVRNVSLDDALCGTYRRAVKTRLTMHSPDQTGLGKTPKRPRFPDLLAEEREVRDAWLWQSFPPANAQIGRGEYRIPKQIRDGVPGKTDKEIAPEFGKWDGVMRLGRSFPATPADPTVWATNAKLGLSYSIDDFRRNRPLPDPYPYKDFGCGVVYPDEDGKGGACHSPIGGIVDRFYFHYPTTFHGSVNQWVATGDESYAHDAAVALARWAYAFPTLYSQDITLGNMLAAVGNCSRAGRFHKRLTTSKFYHWYTVYGTEELDDYDRLFPYLKDNWAVALAVSKFVPWVRTPQDVIKLIDTYLVQHTAKRILRYQWYTGEMKIARLATLLGDRELTDPWMEWLFTGTYVYPLPISGLQDLMVTGTSREGTEYIASTMYAGGENALSKAADLEPYLRAGGNPTYNLSDPSRYPKPLATCYWLLERHLAGLNDLRIGDVCGPDKFYGRSFSGLDNASEWGWKWSKDPVFAYLRKHYFGQKDVSDEEWQAIQKAAAKVNRPPWLDLPSRVLPQWAAILESGRQHDDYRFRRALFLRNGMGWGHHHNDGLDLQLYMHGTMMTCDGGQRPGYSRPGDRSTRMHNLVEVDGLGSRGGDWLGHNWTRALSDARGAKYVVCEAVPPESHSHVELYQRQTALIDVDEGKGSQGLTPEQCKPGTKLPADIVSANSYVFDVVRVAGGKRHTYCFHANLSDGVEHNIENAVADDKAAPRDQAYFSRMADERLAGDAPDHLQLTWKLKDGQVKRDLHPNVLEKGGYCTRLHVLGEKGARVLRGSLNCTQWGYMIPMAFVQRRGADEDDAEAKGNLESAFAAVIEPYVAQPFISDMKLLPIPGNEKDARRAVAVAATTTNGHHDLCFADGRPEKTREVQASGAKCQVSGEFAYHSTDADGLRQASLTGGTLLSSPLVELRPAAREHVGTIRRVDYWKKTLWIDQAWPALDVSANAFVFEVGMGNHWTCYTATKVRPEGNGTAITVKRGADYYLSRIKEIDEENNILYASLSCGSGVEGGVTPTPGIDKHWAATNEDATKSWRADYLGGDRSTGKFGFQLDKPATMADFGRTKGFRLWEYGVGDTVRHSTFASIQRVEPGVFLLQADVDVTLALEGSSLATSVDGKTWQPLKAQAADGKARAAIKLADLARQGQVYVRVK